MKEYKLRFAQYWKVVCVLITVPLIILPFVYVMAEFPTLPGWLVLALIGILLIFITLLVLWLIKRICPKIKLIVTKDELQIAFEQKGILFPDDFVLPFEQLLNFGGDEYSGAYFMSFKATTKPYKFQISAATNGADDAVVFAEAFQDVSNKVKAFNSNKANATTTVTSKTVYKSSGAKVAAAITVILLIGFPLLNIFIAQENEFPWWRYCMVIAFVTPLLYKVYEENWKK